MNAIDLERQPSGGACVLFRTNEAISPFSRLMCRKPRPVARSARYPSHQGANLSCHEGPSIPGPGQPTNSKRADVVRAPAELSGASIKRVLASQQCACRPITIKIPFIMPTDIVGDVKSACWPPICECQTINDSRQQCETCAIRPPRTWSGQSCESRTIDNDVVM